MPHTANGPRLSTLILLSALCILPINIFLPSLPGIADEFGVDYGLVSLSVAAYAATAACLQIIVGPLSDRFGRRPIILACQAIFLVATIGCALAPDIWTFLGCRMVQAVIAPAYAVALSVVRDTTPDRDKASSKIGYIAMAWALAPMLGPTVGGLLDETFGWRASFWFLAGLGLAIFMLCWVDLGETKSRSSNTLVDQFRAYPRLLRSAPFWAYAICMAFSVGAFAAFVTGTPLVAGSNFAFTPALTGIVVGSITGGFMVGSFVAGRIGGRLPLHQVLLSGRLLACGALLLGLVLYAVGLDHPLALFAPCILVGVSNGLTMPSANMGAISSVRADLTGSAAGLVSAAAGMGVAIMSAITGAVLTAENAKLGLLLVMLGSAIIALVAALAARHLEQPRNS